MRVEIVPIRPEFDAEICQIIQSVGAEFGAIGEGFGPSDAEVLAMSQYYREQDRSAYFVALLEEGSRRWWHCTFCWPYGFV